MVRSDFGLRLRFSKIFASLPLVADAPSCQGVADYCAICMRGCPFNRDFSKWTERFWRTLATLRYRKLALWWETKFPNGARLKPKDWWERLSRKSQI